jgi:hypothetical protein
VVRRTWIDFRPCGGCGFDFTTGGGDRGCLLHGCAYLPDQTEGPSLNSHFRPATIQDDRSPADGLAREGGEESKPHVANEEGRHIAHAFVG